MAIEGLKSYYKENMQKMHYLTEEQCEQLLCSAFELLENMGIQMNDDEATELFVKNGASVSDGMLKIPRELVIKCINSAGKEAIFYDQMGNIKMRVGGVNTYFGLGPTNPYTNDFETGERRSSKRSDVANAARVADACPNIDFIMGLAQISDENVAVSDVYEGYEMMTNSTKPVLIWGIDKDGLADQIRIAEVIAGGHDKLIEKPFVGVFPGCPDTPLKINKREAQNMIFCAKSGLPIIWMGGGQLGTVTPVVIPGSASISAAEMLTGICLAQLVNPGCTVIAGFGILTVDMRSMTSAYGSPEHCIGEMMSSDMFKYLNLPNIQTAGVTDSKVVDEQSAIETSMNVLSCILTGANLVHDVGFVDSALSGSVEQIVLSDEVIGYARRIVRPLDFNEVSMVRALIEEVGPGGSYITEEHTFENFRDEVWFPSLIDRSAYKVWEVDKKDFRTRLREKTSDIFYNHKAPEFTEGVQKELQDILISAETRVNASQK